MMKVMSPMKENIVLECFSYTDIVLKLQMLSILANFGRFFFLYNANKQMSNFKVIFPHINFSVTWDLFPLERIASFYRCSFVIMRPSVN